jgi:hypothetical protein
VAGLQCGAENTTFHEHAHLAIAVDGVLQAVPSSIGIAATCLYPLHTHDSSGRIHIESAAPATFTLGQLFAIWGRPLSATNVADIQNAGPIVFYIIDADGTASIYTGDPAAIELPSHRQIVIQIGQPLTQLPNFTWTGS